MDKISNDIIAKRVREDVEQYYNGFMGLTTIVIDGYTFELYGNGIDRYIWFGYIPDDAWYDSIKRVQCNCLDMRYGSKMLAHIITSLIVKHLAIIRKEKKKNESANTRKHIAEESDRRGDKTTTG